jgi:hypothetical protein
MMSDMGLYKRVPVDEVTPVECVGVYVTRWRSEWGEPTYAFVYANEPSEIDALNQRIEELTHKNELLMDSYLESETIDDKGKLVGSLEYFKKRIADLESENEALRLIAGSHSMSELRRNRIMAGIEQFIEKYREGSDA